VTTTTTPDPSGSEVSFLVVVSRPRKGRKTPRNVPKFWKTVTPTVCYGGVTKPQVNRPV
jgi:hypothetical protein